MAKKKKTGRPVYRDKRTGRFVSKKTYTRSKVQGGKRYVRQSLKRKSRVRITTREWTVNVEYTLQVKNNPEIQISVKGPSKANRKRIIEAVEYRFKNGKNPKGWRIRIVEWKKAGKTYAGDDTEATWKAVEGILAEPTTEIEVENQKRRGN